MSNGQREGYAYIGGFLTCALLVIAGVVLVPEGHPQQPFIDRAEKVIHSVEPTPAIRIVGPSEAEPGQLVKLSAEGQGKWAWGASHDNALLERPRDYDTAEGDSRLFFSTSKPGSYVFWLAGSDTLVPHVLTIRGGVPPQPTPEPEPTPTPPVPPPPHVSKAYVLIVYESKSVTPEQSRVYTNLRDGPAAKYLKDKGHLLDIVDQNKHPATKFAPFKSLPEMLVLPLEGRYEAAPVWRGPMPATADGVVEQIKRVGG